MTERRHPYTVTNNATSQFKVAVTSAEMDTTQEMAARLTAALKQFGDVQNVRQEPLRHGRRGQWTITIGAARESS